MSDKQKEYLCNIKKRKLIIVISRITILLSLILIWEYLSYKEIINPFIYSSPKRIMMTIFNLFKTHNLFPHIFSTIIKIIIAFIISNILAFITAVILYESPLTAKIIDPFLTVFNSLPKVALGPIIIIICGANSKSIIAMAILINLIVSIITMLNGFQNTDKIKIKMFKTFNATKKDTLLRLVIPSSYPNIIASLKLNISLTLIGVITGEFLVSKKGIGYLIIYGSQVFNLDLVFAGIVILLIISYILYKFVIIIEKKLVK